MTPPRRSEPIPFTGPAAALAFTTILTRGPISRGDVGRHTGLSPSAVTNAVRPLLESAYLVEDQPEDTTIGRPAMPLRVWAERAYFVGVKVAGSEIIAVLTDLRSEIRATEHQSLVPGGVESVTDTIGEAIETLLSHHPELRARVCGLGVALSGDVDREVGMVRYSPFLGWREVPFAQLIASRTGLPTTIDNDVRALTAAEQWFGAGNGARSFALITVGSGIGCGLVVNDSVITGAHGVTGELGHVTIDPRGPRCHCGNRGCLEAIAADPAIVRQINALSDVHVENPTEAAALAHGGHDGARAVYARAGQAIGQGIAAVVNLFGPERVIISGEGAAVYDLFAQHMRESFAQHAFSTADQSEIIVCPLGFDEWARGAATVAIRAFINPPRG